MFSFENSSIWNHTAWSSLFGNSTGSEGGTVPEGCVLKPGSQPAPSDDKHSLIPKGVDVIFGILLTGICLPVCFLVSFFTNLLNLAVFWKQGLRERIDLCLFTLSLLDMLYVAVMYGQNSFVLYMLAVGKGGQIGPPGVFFIKTHLIGLNSLVTASMACSAVVSLERCLCISRPLLARTLMTTKTTAVALWSALLILIAGDFVTGGLRLTVRCVFDPGDNSTVFRYYPTQFYLQNKPTIDVFGGVIFGLFLPVVFVTCVAVCTVVVVLKMKKVTLWREAVSSAPDSLASRDLAVTRMIVGTSVLFIVCTVPSITVRIALNLIPGLKPGERYENMYLVLVKIYSLASVINSSFNFFVYYAYGSKFRRTLYQLFSRCCCYRKKLHGSSNDISDQQE